MENYQPFHEGLKRLSGNAAAQRTAIDAVSVSDLQAAIIAIISAATGRGPYDGEVIGFESASGNLIWMTGGTVLSIFKRPDGTSGYFRPDGTSTYNRAA